MIAVSCSYVSRESRLRRDRKGHRVLYTSRLQHRMVTRNSSSGSVGNVNSRRGLWPVKTFGRLASHHSASTLDVYLYLTFPTTRMFFFCGRADARTHNSGSLINSPPIHRSVGIPVLGALSMRSRCAILYMTVT